MQFGVDTKFNEFDDPIWEGYAESKEDAIDKAVKANWKDEKIQELMKGYMKAVEFECN